LKQQWVALPQVSGLPSSSRRWRLSRASGSISVPEQFRVAGPFWKSILWLVKSLALTMPWGRVYVHPTAHKLLIWPDIVAHESVHLAQIKRDGAFAFSATYLWHLITIGYWDMPYEIEARAAHE
jgi:hypothetical protein